MKILVWISRNKVCRSNQVSSFPCFLVIESCCFSDLLGFALLFTLFLSTTLNFATHRLLKELILLLLNCWICINGLFAFCKWWWLVSHWLLYCQIKQVILKCVGFWIFLKKHVFLKVMMPFNCKNWLHTRKLVFTLTSIMWNFTQGEDAEQQLLEGSDGFCSLTATQRVYAFAACLLGGFLFMLLSLIVFAIPIKFALLFTLGNLFSVGSTAFLIGHEQQLRMMLDPVRVYDSNLCWLCCFGSCLCSFDPQQDSHTHRHRMWNLCSYLVQFKLYSFCS